jgi:HEAT repeat protein
LPFPDLADFPNILSLQDSIQWRSLDPLKDLTVSLADWNFDFQDAKIYNLATTYSGQGDYVAGKELLGQRKYAEAISHFDRVIAKKTGNVEGALYWKAYAQFKLGKTDESLAAIAQLRKDHAQSRYLTDAKVLEADARRRTGQPVNPEDSDNEEIKMLALNGIKNTDPERAIPLLEGILNATNSLSLKKRALFILAGINQPRAHQILLGYAKGSGNPDLQLEAIRYIAANSNKQTTGAELMQIYQSSSDTDVKLAVIGALRSSGDRSNLFTIASDNSFPTVVRTSALNGLSGILGPAEVWTLYEKETNKDLKLQMVSLFGSMQALDQLSRIVKTEKDPEVRRRAVRSLGNMKSDKTGQMLVDVYTADQDVETRKAVIAGLATQNNAEGLVAIARKESSLALKTEIVRKLSDMAPKSKVAADYLMEIIK